MKTTFSQIKTHALLNGSMATVQCTCRRSGVVETKL